MSEATSPEPHLGIHLLFAGATAFITVAAMYAAVLLLGLGAVLSGVNVQEAVKNPTWLVIGAAVTQSAVALVALGAARFWRRYQGVSTREALRQCFPVGRPSAASFLGALLVVFGITPLALGIAQAIQRAFDVETASEAVVRIAAGAPPLTFTLLMLCVAVLPGLVEEALFRGFVTRLFVPWYWVAWFVPSVLFGMVHMDLVQSVGTMILGLGFGWIRLRTGSVLPSMLAHMVYNGAVLCAARFAGDQGDDKTIPLLVVAGGVLMAALGSWMLGVRATPLAAAPPQEDNERARED
ncbi:MAG: CPBP family intramembrane glutamic endopeptidase [Polyangiaceae bacterium]